MKFKISKIYKNIFSLNANNNNNNVIQNFKNNSFFTSKQIFGDLSRVIKSLMENSLNFNIDEETYNRNNISNFSANSSFIVKNNFLFFNIEFIL